MRPFILFLIAPVLSVTPLILYSHPHLSHNFDREWKLAMEKNGVAIYTRKVQEDGADMRETKSVMSLSVPLKNVSELMRGSSEIWHCLELVESVSEVVVAMDRLAWSSYIVIDLPWPMGKQDLVICSEYYNYGASGVRIESRSCPELVPVARGIKRMEYFRTTWILEAIDANTTRVEYIARARGRSKVPRWIVDPIVHNNLVEMFGCIAEGAYRRDAGVSMD